MIFITPKKLSALKGKGIVEVDGAGLYCCLTTRENYMKNIFKPYDKILGPDFDFGINLRQRGLKIILTIQSSATSYKERVANCIKL